MNEYDETGLFSFTSCPVEFRLKTNDKVTYHTVIGSWMDSSSYVYPTFTTSEILETDYLSDEQKVIVKENIHLFK
jgi:hypothetical protein